jgi:6-phosphogluconolactonase
MQIQVFSDADAAARHAAALIASEARAAMAARGRFAFAVSGGHTPWIMLRYLAEESVDWQHVYLVQVDERAAPLGHADRNLTHLREAFLDHVPIKESQILAMPVDATDLNAATAQYTESLRQAAGSPPVLDLIHLGLGDDGHTASLVPGDRVLSVEVADVALAGPYQGWQRMTLTFPVLNRARNILWLVTGATKSAMLARLIEGDRSIPAGRVQRHSAQILADRDAAGSITAA